MPTFRFGWTGGSQNSSWFQRFPNAHISHLTMATSDHCPLLLCTIGSQVFLPHPFRFEEFWIRDVSSHYEISKAWFSSTGPFSYYSLQHKLSATRVALRSWNKRHFGFIKGKIRKLLFEIDSIQHMLPSANNRAKLVLRINLDEQYQREQILWRQKSRDSWLIQKELNTKFFYTLTIIRRKRNSISSIKNSDHLWVSSRMDIENLFVLFCKDMFNSSSPSVSLIWKISYPKLSRQMTAAI